MKTEAYTATTVTFRKKVDGLFTILPSMVHNRSLCCLGMVLVAL
jgi:hypothetical protein